MIGCDMRRILYLYSAKCVSSTLVSPRKMTRSGGRCGSFSFASCDYLFSLIDSITVLVSVLSLQFSRIFICWYSLLPSGQDPRIPRKCSRIEISLPDVVLHSVLTDRSEWSARIVTTDCSDPPIGLLVRKGLIYVCG